MNDARFMGLALEVAARGLGRTAPNPVVGAVLVRDGQVLAEGYTQPPGQDHAEVHALKQLGGKALGATAYVTLEPCCHWGRTPPCTDSLLQAGVARVVIGTIDPFHLVAGEGVRKLRAAGVEVTVGVRQAECRRMILGFLRSTLLGLPAVTLKAAITLDGRIASATGESRWITGPAAREQAHRLRDRHDAVMVGIGTVLADDPELTTRIVGGRDARPVVLDTHLRIPRDARLLRRRPLILCGPAAQDPGLEAEVVRVPLAGEHIDLRAALGEVARRGMHRVLAEGGAKVHRSLLEGGLADSMEIFLNGRVLAGGPGFVGGPGYALADAPSFRFGDIHRFGDDLHLHLERDLDELLPSDYPSAH